jgi:hypothetical protein
MFLSIDIGLRNLAMCLMTASDKNDLTTYSIKLWNVFNTLNSDEYRCEHLQKSGKICNKLCGFTYKDSSNQNAVYCCKTHFPKDISITKSNIFKKKKIDEYLLQDIAKIVLEKLDSIYRDNIELFLELKNIVIELQPKVNQKMKFTSHIIYGKLVELMKDTNCTIRFVRASQKLKCYTGPVLTCNLKGSYAKRKWLSIQYCKWFLENKFNKEEMEKWIPFFDSHQKKDDIGDTFLMAINLIYGIPKKQAHNKKGKCIK